MSVAALALTCWTGSPCELGGQRTEHVGHALGKRDGGHLHVAVNFVGQHTGGVVDQALGQLAGVGEHLVELLHLLLKIGHDIAARDTSH